VSFLAHGDASLANHLIRNWNRGPSDELKELLPKTDDFFDESVLEITGPGSENVAVRAKVRERVAQALIEHQADRIFRALDPSGESDLPISVSLDEFLEREYSDSSFVIDELMTFGANVFLVAAAKTGKTSLILNLIKSLADDIPFLGSFAISPLKGRIGLLDFELEERMANSWYKRLDITNKARVEHFAFRGHGNPFQSEKALNDLAEQLKFHEIEFLIMDPFSSIFFGNHNDNGEVKEFLKRVDAFKVKAGVKHLVMAVHAGRDQSKTRGASTLDDHPDALWYLSKDSEGTRVFRAAGRDVDVEECYLVFEASSGEMRIIRGSKVVGSLRTIQLRILRYVKHNPGATASSIDSAITGNTTLKAKARAELVKSGELKETSGPRGAKFYHLGDLDEETIVRL